MCRMRWFVLVMLAVGLLGVTVSAQSVNNPGTFIKATSNSVETLDPQFMLSSATTEISFNVYDSLLDRPQGDLETLIPGIATVVPTLDNGLIVVADDGTTYITFPIRLGVAFHNGAVLTSEDVEYTFKRALLVGGQASSIHMLAQNLLGKGSFSDLVDEIGYDAAYEILDQMVTANDVNVTFKLPEPFVPFLGIMADGGSSLGILNKAWCIEQGCWPGTKETGQQHMNKTMEGSPLFAKMMGTGPFKFVSWEPMVRVVLDGFADYWQGAPALDRVIRKIVEDAQTAILLLKNGDIDFTTVRVSELPQVQGAEGLTVLDNLPSTWLMKINFVMDIAANSPYIGEGILGSNGIPTNFFSDLDLRKAFQYSFNWDVFINEVFLGAALKPYGPVLIGFPTANPDNPQYYFDPVKAEEFFRTAWGGEVWEKGFHFTAVYSTGSMHRQRALEILKANVEALNPKFQIDLASLPWAAHVGAIKEKQLPFSLFGMLPDVFDPYLPLFYHMHSTGGYADWSGYVDLAVEKYDDLINELGRNYDPERRREISYELQRMEYEDSLSIFHFQAVQHVAMRDWVQGYYVGPFPSNLDFYPIYKGY